MGKRMKVLGKRRSMVIVTLAVVLLAVGAWIGSGANFSKTEAASANNVITAGFVDLTGDSLTANIGPLAPGGSATGSATVQNDGDVEGHFYLRVIGPLVETAGQDTNVPPATGRVLSEVLRIYVTGWQAGATEQGPYSLPNLVNGTQEFDCGLLDASDGAPGGTDTGTVTLRAEFPDGDTGLGRGADNGFMKATTTFTLLWTVVSTGN